MMFTLKLTARLRLRDVHVHNVHLISNGLFHDIFFWFLLSVSPWLLLLF